MNDIQSFTFFDGYYEALKELDEKTKKDFLLAIVEYVFDGIEPDFKGIQNALWVLIKPSLDKSVVRSKAKKTKSNEEQNEIKTESKQNQNEIKTKSNQNQNEIKNQTCSLLEKEIEKEKEIEIEEEKNNSCSCRKEEELQQLMIKCTGSMNLQSIDECISYLDDLPYEVIEQALLKTAECNGTWRYTKKILQEWLNAGIKTIEQVKAEELNFKKNKIPKDETEDQRLERILGGKDDKG